MKIFENFSKYFILGIFFIILNSCSSKVAQEYNKSDFYWYSKMIDDISKGYMEKANDSFVSLQIEHKNSFFISSALLILIKTYINEEKYKLANYYLELYSEKFSNNSNIDYIEYMNIKIDFLSMKYQNRNQEFLLDTLTRVDDFINKFSTSYYLLLVKNIQSTLLISKSYLYKNIASLYKTQNKQKAYELYLKKSHNAWSDFNNTKAEDLVWYRSIFE